MAQLHHRGYVLQRMHPIFDGRDSHLYKFRVKVLTFEKGENGGFLKHLIPTREDYFTGSLRKIIDNVNSTPIFFNPKTDWVGQEFERVITNFDRKNYSVSPPSADEYQRFSKMLGEIELVNSADFRDLVLSKKK